jgi:hypothetical protein
MHIDWRTVAIAAALIAFNFPILIAALQTLRVKDLSEQVGNALKEKDAAGDPTEATSYSRVAGAVGAVMLASLFWVVSNVVVVDAIISPPAIAVILSGAGKLFLLGTALFLPYVFNQLKTVLQ